MMSRSYPVIIEKDSSGFYVVTCPILEGCYSQGKTIEEAMENIKEAIQLCVEDIDDEQMPDPNIMMGQVVV